MTGIEIAGGIVMLICSVLLAIVVVMQESPEGGLSALGASDSHFSRNQERTRDAMLVKVTKVLGTVFIVVTLLTYGITVWFGGK